MIVRLPWSKALRLEWHRPCLARRIRGERCHAALERSIQAHREMIESISGVHPASRGFVVQTPRRPDKRDLHQIQLYAHAMIDHEDRLWWVVPK